YRLFAHDERDKIVGIIRPVVLAVAFVELLQLGLVPLMSSGGDVESASVLGGLHATLRLLFCVAALMLAATLCAGAAAPARETLRWPAAALGLLWLYDLNVSLLAYRSVEPPEALVTLRGGAMLAVIAMLALGVLRHDGNLRFRPSRSL